MKYTNLQQELDDARKTVQIWIDNEDQRIEKLINLANTLTNFRNGIPYGVATLQMSNEDLHLLEKAAYLTLGLVGTAKLMVKETTPPSPDPGLN